MVRIYPQPRGTRHTFTLACGSMARSGVASARHNMSSIGVHGSSAQLFSPRRLLSLHLVCLPERSQGSAFLLSVPASSSAFSAPKITACQLPSKQKWSSTCQLSAVSCQPIFSFALGAATVAGAAPLKQTPAPTQAYYSCPPLTTQQIPASKSFRMRSSARQAYNSFRIRTSKTKDLKPCRMNTYEKTPGGEVLLVNEPVRQPILAVLLDFS